MLVKKIIYDYDMIKVILVVNVTVDYLENNYVTLIILILRTPINLLSTDINCLINKQYFYYFIS